MVNFSHPMLGRSYWKVMRDTNGYPIEVKEWVLVDIGGKQNHCLYFNNAGDTQFAYAHHYNDDWFDSFREGADAMQEILNRCMADAKRRVEQLEVIQHNLVEAINRHACASHVQRQSNPNLVQMRSVCSNGISQN